jgi:transposase
MTAKKQKPKPNCYNRLPRKVTQNEFNTFIKPCLSRNKRGRKPKISYYKIFNYILKVLRTGMQWDELETRNNEISWQNVYHYHNRWSKDGSYRRLFENSVITLDALGKLDLTILHGDGSNVVAKKGARKSIIPDTSTKKARKY